MNRKQQDDPILIDVTPEPKDGGDWRRLAPQLIPTWLVVIGGAAAGFVTLWALMQIARLL